MLAALLERAPIPATQLTAAHDALRDALEQQVQLAKDVERCRVDMDRHDKLSANAATAQAALVELHAGRAAGEGVTDKQIADSEAALKNAMLAVERAAFARQGTVAALQRFEDKAALLPEKIESLRAKVKESQAAALIEKVEAAQRVYQAKVETFVAGAYSEFMGTILAAEESAEQFKIMDGNSGIPGVYRRRLPGLPVHFSPKIEMYGVPRLSRGCQYDSTEFDATDSIEKAAQPIRKLFASLG